MTLDSKKEKSTNGEAGDMWLEKMPLAENTHNNHWVTTECSNYFQSSFPRVGPCV